MAGSIFNNRLAKTFSVKSVGLLEQRKDKSEVKRSIGNIQFDYKLHFFPRPPCQPESWYDISQGEGTVVVNDSAASSYRRSPDAKHGGVNNRYLQKNQIHFLKLILTTQRISIN